jgi:general secretion pathway protein F
MGRYRYKALDAEGVFVAGEAEASDARALTERLRASGHVVLETRDARAGAGRGRSLFTPSAPRPAAVTVFLRDLAMVLRAGVPLDGALRLLAGEERGGLAAIADDLHRSVTGGAGLAEAMGAHPGLFGADLVTMVRVAEAAGTLDHVLETVAASRARAEATRETIASSLRYPIFLLVAATGVLLFFLTAVVPQFAGVLEDYGTADSGIVGVVIGLSKLLEREGRTIAALAAALGAVAFLVLRRPAVRLRLLAGLGRLPVIAGLATMRRTAVFCDGLATLLANGVALSEALGVLADAPGERGGPIERVAAAVRRGRRLAEALTTEQLLPPLAIDMLRIGEETSELASVARRIADFYDARLSARAQRLAAIVGPSAIVIIAVLIGGLIVSILTALLSIDRLVL